MATFKLRPDTFDALEFTGGKKNATDLMKWLRKYDLSGSWSPAVLIDSELSRESFLILTEGRADRIYVGTWIVFDQKPRRFGEFTLMYDPEFNSKYEIHEES
jgi:hypothetical protein